MDSTDTAQTLAMLIGVGAIVALVVLDRQLRGTADALLPLAFLLTTAASVLLLVES